MTTPNQPSTTALEEKDLGGMKHCIHQRTFYGMKDGRCIKCGGWLSDLGKHPSLQTSREKLWTQLKEIIRIYGKYYERDDKDDYFFILRDYEINQIADKMVTHILKNYYIRDQANATKVEQHLAREGK